MNVPALTNIPRGFHSFVTSCGIKDDTLDLGIIFSEKPARAAALFTQSSVPGAPIIVGKEHVKNGQLSAVVVNSKNANVATGSEGLAIARQICEKAATELGIETNNVLPSSTGVIGRRLPVEKVLAASDSLKSKLTAPAAFDEFARSIMTTDTFPKYASVKIGEATLVGVAKGSGMIEPEMATMLAYFFTDADISAKVLDKMIRRIANPSFNSLSIDTDTSTSDTVAILANGLAGKVDESAFEAAWLEMATQLTRWLARDGEGATKIFEVTVSGAKTEAEAKLVAKAIINSPLVKTAIYQGDPNWGRIVMAIGKTPAKVNADAISIKWGNHAREYSNEQLDELQRYLKDAEEVFLTVDLGVGKAAWTVFGCDLTEEYVKINAYYTT